MTGSSPGASCSDSRYVAAADLDVEHVDLAVGRAVLAVGPDVDARVRAARGALDALGDRAGDEVDAELARRRARPGRARGRPSGSAPAAVCSGVPSTGHFSGSTTSSAPCAAASRVSRSAASRLRSRSGVELSWTAAARMASLLRIRRLTRQSITETRGYPAMPLLQGLDVGRGLRPGPDAVRGERAGRALRAPRWWAVWDGERLHERSFRRAARSCDARARARARRAGAELEPGAPWAVRERRDLDAQAPGRACAGRRSAARSTCPGWSTSRRAATRAAWPGWWSRRRGRAGGRAAGDLEPGRRAARRRQRVRARGLDRRRPGGRPAAAVRRAAAASATCASTRSPRARGARTCSSWPRTTSSRSGRSPARCRPAARCAPATASWSVIARAGDAAQLLQQHLRVHRADQLAQRLAAGADDLGRAARARRRPSRSSSTAISRATSGASASR